MLEFSKRPEAGGQNKEPPGELTGGGLIRSNYGLPWSLPFTEVNCPQPPRRTNLRQLDGQVVTLKTHIRGKRVRRNRISRRCDIPTLGARFDDGHRLPLRFLLGPSRRRGNSKLLH